MLQDIPLDQMLAFTRKNESSVIPAWNAVIGKAIRKTYDVGQKDIVCYVPIDLRPIFHFETGRKGIIRMKFVQSYESDVLTKRIYEEFSALIPETAFKDLGYHEFDEYPV